MSVLNDYKSIAVLIPDYPDVDCLCAAYALKAYILSEGRSASIICRKNDFAGSAGAAAEYFSIRTETDISGNFDFIIAVGMDYEGDSELYSLSIDRRRNDPTRIKDKTRLTFFNAGVSSVCSVVWSLLLDTDMATKNIAGAALYCGLYCATNKLAELNHPFDLDMIEFLVDSIPNIEKVVLDIYNADFSHPAFANERLWVIAGQILSGVRIIETPSCSKIGLFKAQGEYITNSMLSRLSDIILDFQVLDCVILYFVTDADTVYMSVRSRVREIMASEILNFIFSSFGTVRGDMKSASGHLEFSRFGTELHGGFSVITPEIFVEKRLADYVSECDLIFCGSVNENAEELRSGFNRARVRFSSDINFADMDKYLKTPMPVGFAKTTDFFQEGTPILVRTLEGDIDVSVSEDTYLMIGILGEIYPIKRDRFRATYKELDGVYDMSTEYDPAVINRLTGERVSVREFTKLCMATGEKTIMAIPIKRNTKVFTFWDKSRYFFGKPGDYLAANDIDVNDCYIVRGDIFNKTYEHTGSSGIGKLYHLISHYETAAFVDELTGLQNRNAYLARISSFCTHSNMPLGIVVGDVNYLKKINDTLGHTAGDRLLKTVTAAVGECLPYGTFAARTGGDELLILFPGGGKAAADRFIENVCADFKKINDEVIGEPSVSWGSSEMTSETDNYDEMYKLADERMYEDKKRRKAQRVD
jgi:phosphoglycolate phosphatase